MADIKPCEDEMQLHRMMGCVERSVSRWGRIGGKLRASLAENQLDIKKW